MTPERWQQISRLYHAAAHCEGEDRAAFLAEVCSGDPELRRELESLLSGESGAALLDRVPMDARPSFVGRTIGPYEITSLLGAGGMGEVYRARDTRLDRDVALKVLPELSALGADRLARFRREAQLLASLDHPNISHIYGMEEAAGVYALVLEYVEGQTLTDRVAQGPLPRTEAIAIARQIVDALQAAHGRGIVHRDLKPANIAVRRDGTVKVLDFGLAKALAPQAAAVSGDSMMTARGVVLGTVAYMAPEQARGRDSDTRADIWAFGVVLYEMLTGRSPFAGDSIADTVGAVLHTEPDWSRVPDTVRPLLERCLQKDPARRLQDIADARLWLDGIPQRARGSARRALWAVAAVAAMFFIATVALSISYFGASSPAVHMVRFQVAPPPEHTFGGYFVLSPDGRHLAYQALDRAGRRTIWVHSLDSGESRVLPRTGESSSSSIFWSPDSRFIGFVGNDAKMRKIEVSGGPPQIICDLPGAWGGASWSPEGVIVFGQRTGGLMQVSAQGGVPSALTILDDSRTEIGHGAPRFLPDGRHFVYHRAANAPNDNGLYVGSLDVEPQHQSADRLLSTTARPIYVPSEDPRRGHLMLVNDGALLAYPFDARRRVLAGEAVRIAEDVGAVPNWYVTISSVTASSTGAIAFRASESTSRVPMWVDRHGRELEPLVPEALDRAGSPRISPDGRRVALVVAGDLWVFDIGGRPPIRLTFGGDADFPVWTPDGRRIVFLDDRRGVESVAADAYSAPAVPAGPKGYFLPFDWSPKGELLAAVFNELDADVVRFTPNSDARPEVVVRSPAAEGTGGTALSPNGRWLAYTSNATGRYEIWVQPYPGPGTPVRVSPNEGTEPVWASGGEELYYLQGSQMMSVPVKTGDRFEFGAALVLFDGRYARPEPPSFDVGADGRFLVLKPSGAPEGTSPIQVVLNWMALLDQR